ncbi:hypothetical protein BVY01_03030 [bacterium I07]|nr:hypothetical protein BVY01_03030 [bacterium I07]
MFRWTENTPLCKEDGFTFIEVTICIVIVGIMAVVVRSNFGGTDDEAKVYQAVSRVLNDVRYCQEMAMNTNREVHFYVSTADNKYWAVFEDNASYLISPTDNNDFIVQLGSGDYEGIAISSSDFTSNPLEFTDCGRPQKGDSYWMNPPKDIIELNGSNIIKITGAGYTYKTD